MINNGKKHVVLNGRVLSLEIGERALIATDRSFIRTSTVAAITYPNSNSVVFETQNSVYWVSFTSVMEAAVISGSVLPHYNMLAA